MTIYYLYVKTHNITGLKYLGKTIQNPHKYRGSGKKWKSHIHKHGYNVTTEILKECSSDKELKEWGLYYSRLWNIVEARDENGNKLWANLKLEEGDGAPSGKDWSKIFSKEAIEKRSATYKKNYYSNSEKQKEKSAQRTAAMNNPDTKLKHKASMKEAMNKPTTKDKCSKSQQIAWADPLEREKRIAAQTAAQNRPEMILMRSGKNNHKYDHTIYKFASCNGIIECGTRNDFCEKHNLNKGKVRELINGKIKQFKGWIFISKEEGD